jgi:hypothetical protein
MIQPVPKSHKEEKKHLSTSQFSNNITSSDYRIFALVRAANRIQQRRPPNNSTSARKCAPSTQSSNRRIWRRKSIYRCRKWNKLDIRKNASSNAYTRVPQANRLFLLWNRTWQRKLPIALNSTQRLFRQPPEL